MVYALKDVRFIRGWCVDFESWTTHFWMEITGLDLAFLSDGLTWIFIWGKVQNTIPLALVTNLVVFFFNWRFFFLINLSLTHSRIILLEGLKDSARRQVMLPLFTLSYDVAIDCAGALSGLYYFPVLFHIFLAIEFIAIFFENAKGLMTISLPF